MRTREQIMTDLVAEVLDDPAHLDAKTRRAAAAAGNREAGDDHRSKALRALAEKIHGGAFRVTDDDIKETLGAGLSEDEVFEAVVSASLGAGKKRFDAAMAALAAASAPAKKAAGGAS